PRPSGFFSSITGASIGKCPVGSQLRLQAAADLDRQVVMRLVVIAVLGFALSSSPRSAHAACDTGLSTCIEADTFWPHAGPAYFNVVGGTTTTSRGALGFGWSTTYVARPIVLLLPSSQPGGTEVVAVDHLWNATFLFSYGLAERIEATLAIPTTLYRTGTGISALTQQ